METPNPTPTPKSGFKTSEFVVALLAVLSPAVLQSIGFNAEDTQSLTVEVLSVASHITAAVVGSAFIWSRVKVKLGK